MRGSFVLGPDNQALLGDFIRQSQHRGLALDQDGARTQAAPVFGGGRADEDALRFWDGIETMLALLAASDNPAFMKLAGSTTAIGLTAFAPKQIKGALNDRLGSLEAVQSSGRGGLGAPQLLA